MKKNKITIINNFDELREEINARQTTKYSNLFSQGMLFKEEYGELCLDFTDGGQTYTLPIRETALPSILARMGIAGKTFYEMSDKELCEVFQHTQPYMPNMVCVMVSDGCVNSVNSDIYAHIPMEEILDQTMEVIAPLFKSEPKISASIGYDLTHIKFYCDKSYSFNGKARKLVITLTNSENGTSCVRYAAYIRVDNGLMPIMSDLAVTHKGDEAKGSDKVIESIGMLEKVVTESIKAIRALQRIEVNHIATTIEACGKRIGIPRKYIDVVKKEFVNKKTCLASEIYESFANAIAVQDNLATFERYKNDVVKLINFDWEGLNK